MDGKPVDETGERCITKLVNDILVDDTLGERCSVMTHLFHDTG